MAVLPFDNLTTEPTLTQEVNTAVQTAMEGRLGLRAAGESTADAVVRGSITRYEPDLPVAYTGSSSGTQNVTVTQRALQMTINIEVYDQRAAKSIWQRSGLIVEANYPPGQEREGRQRALDKLVTDIVDGAQSQW
ncbi:MAG TPA: LPS assembly lipoprotein LptE [Gemmatimonadales bacterium]|nr:LPS assembly lipoprotein LptE [Gemmatimonadales bacterium]